MWALLCAALLGASTSCTTNRTTGTAGTSVQAVVAELEQGRARGVQTIVGIVTDGDLRRQMRPDLLALSVDEVMTKTPKTISRDTLAGEALELLNASKITTLIVTDAKKPVGIIHLHDLLRAGVA
jgi:CBS domain-containing protein